MKPKQILSIIGICLLTAVLFYLPQGILAVMLAFGMKVYGKVTGQTIDSDVATVAPYLSYLLLVAEVIVVALFVAIKYVNLKTVFSASKIQWRLVPLIILAAVAGIFASDLINEKFELEDLLGEEMLAIARTIPGMLAIAIVGPIAEEIVFRGALIGKLRQKGLGPWVSILISAFVFGAIHGNPIQIPFAMIVGVILGIIYVKTESVLLCSICHVFNNTSAVVAMNLCGDTNADMTWAEVLGGDLNANIALVVCLVVSTFFFGWYWKKQ